MILRLAPLRCGRGQASTVEAVAEPQRQHVQAAWASLQEFQSRASEVLDCAVARRADVATLGTSMTILFRREEPGHAQLVREHLPQAELTEAAGFLRPFFLARDPVYHGKITKALKLLTRSSESAVREKVERLGAAWQQLPRGTYWSMAVATGSDGATPMLTDRRIADDWLYGHFLHHDVERRERIRHVPVGDRLLAATLWVKDGVLLTAATQRLIVELEEHGHLHG